MKKLFQVNDTSRKVMAVLSIIAPLLFIPIALLCGAVDSTSTVYQYLFYLNIYTAFCGPILGLIFGLLAYKSKLAKVGIIFNSVALAYYALFIFVILPRAI